ncbi:hypothetical protein F5877DRAFT_93524 [Lentinula edodes]|nr:hypothetical protein F5877DRAFT_93524 [Lentinula edodes]
MSKAFETKSTVVIVGGGTEGVVIARSLSKTLDPQRHKLLLINKHPFRLILPALLRMLVFNKGKLEERVFVPYDKVNAGDNSNSGSLALSDGSKWDGLTSFPNDAANMKMHIAARREEIAKANDILLVSGGAVGIELAGEIKDIWPRKSVMVLNRGAQLLNNTYSSKLRHGLWRQLVKRSVKVILDDYIEELPTCPNVHLLSSLYKFLTPSGTVKVLPSLQLPSHPNIFALGDLIEWGEQKTAAKAQMGHAPVVVKNVELYLKGVDVSKAGNMYKGSMEMILKSGMSWMDVMGGIIFGPFLTSSIKSKDLIIEMARGACGN